MSNTRHPGLLPRKKHRFLLDPTSVESAVKVVSTYPHPMNDDIWILEYEMADGDCSEAIIDENILLAYALTQKVS